MYLSWIILVAACLLQETWAVSLRSTGHDGRRNRGSEKAYLSSVIKSMHDLDTAAEQAMREQELSNADVEQAVVGVDNTADALSDVEVMNRINDINERLSIFNQSIQTVIKNQVQIKTRLSALEAQHTVDEVSTNAIQEPEAAQPPASEDNLTDEGAVDAMQQLLGNAEVIIQEAMDLLVEGDVEQVVGNEETEGQEEATPGPAIVAPMTRATTIPPKTEPPSQVTMKQPEDITLARETTENTAAQVTTVAILSQSQSPPQEDANEQTRKPLAGQRSGQQSETTSASVKVAKETDEPQSATTAPPESVTSANAENNEENGVAQEEAENVKATEQITIQLLPVATEPATAVDEEADEAASPTRTEGERRELGEYHPYSFRGYNHFTDARRDDLLRRIRINLSQRQVPFAHQPYVVRERVPLDKGGYRRPISQTQ